MDNFIIDEDTKLNGQVTNILGSRFASLFLSILYEQTNLSSAFGSSAKPFYITCEKEYETANFKYSHKVNLNGECKQSMRLIESKLHKILITPSYRYILSGTSQKKKSFLGAGSLLNIKVNKHQVLYDSIFSTYRGYPIVSISFISHLIAQKVKDFIKSSQKYCIPVESFFQQFAYNCNKYMIQLYESKGSLSPKKRHCRRMSSVTLNDQNSNTGESTQQASVTTFKETISENDKKKLMKQLEQKIRVSNKINVYVAEYETLVNRQNEPCQEYKIYDGTLVRTHYLKYNPNLMGYEKKVLSVNVNDLLHKQVKSIFVPNDIKLANQKKILHNRMKKDGIVHENGADKTITHSEGESSRKHSKRRLKNRHHEFNLPQIGESGLGTTNTVSRQGLSCREEIKTKLKKKNRHSNKRELFNALTFYNKYVNSGAYQENSKIMSTEATSKSKYLQTNSSFESDPNNKLFKTEISSNVGSSLKRELYSARIKNTKSNAISINNRQLLKNKPFQYC